MKCAKTCDCDKVYPNTGTGCSPLMKVTKRPWIIPVTDSTGALNYIDLTTTLNDAYFTGLINQTDSSKRLYPLPEIKNVDDIRDQPVTFEWKDGTKVFVRDGARKFTGMFPPESATPQLNGILESFRCGKPGFFGVDADGTIWGKVSEDGTKLYPVSMDAQSIAAIFTKPTDSDPQMIGFSFNFSSFEKDCVLGGLFQSELESDVTSTLSYDGLMDVYAKVISCSTTVLVVKLYTNFGTAKNPVTVKGLLATNFALYNKTTSSAILLTGTGAAFSESSGTYTITFKTADDPSATNQLRLTPSKNGYDFTAVVATSIVVS